MILLEDVETPFGNIKIMQCRTDGTFTYYQDRCFHSQATEDGVSTCVYIHVLYEVIRQCAAKRVLLIGCAGGTLATILSRIGCQVTVVDVNDYSFTIARRYFCMPKEVECITGDGAEYVQKTQREYDAIVIDAFERKANIPDSMTNTSFFESLTRCLSSKGIVLMNIMTAHDKDLTADRIALCMEQAGFPTELYDWTGTKDRNTLLIGNVRKTIRLPSGKEPAEIKREIYGLKSRKAKRTAA